MRIQKKFQGTVPKNKILNTHSDSETDTYSCNKINELISSGTGTGTIDFEGDITTNNNSRLKDKDLNIISISHRGYNPIAPENTLPAFILAKEKGFNYVECDVSFTSDGVPVLLHDDTIDRTSNGSGKISNLTYNQVLQYDFGSWKSNEYAGTKIPTFKEFIVLCKNIGLHPCIELKDNGNYTQEQILEIVDIVKNCGMKGNVTYVSFNINYLNYVKEYDNQARLGYVMFDITQQKVNETLNLKSGINDVFITASYANLTDSKIQMCADNCIPLEMWSVNDVDVIKNMNSYISGVTSDELIASKVLIENYGINNNEETDPTVPKHVKDITIEDIKKWNSGTGGSGGSGGSLEIETITITPKETINQDGGTIGNVGIVQKCGNECKLIMNSTAGMYIPNATYTVVGVIPEGYRPKENVVFVASGRKTDYANFYDFVVVVYINGDISVLQRTGSNFKVGDIRGSVSYYIDEPLQLPGGSSSQVYSEEETVIGTWLGKPLYRKVISVDVTSLTELTNYITYDCSTIDRCTDLRAITERQYNIVETVPRIADAKNLDAWYSMIQLDKANNRFIIELGSTLKDMVKNGYWFYIIFEYTKTTD